MRVGIRLELAAGEIRKVLLLAVVPIAMVIPGGNVALGQRGTGTMAQAPLFTAIDLTPSGLTILTLTASLAGSRSEMPGLLRLRPPTRCCGAAARPA